MIWATEFHTMITFEQPNQQSYGSILSLSAIPPQVTGRMRGGLLLSCASEWVVSCFPSPIHILFLFFLFAPLLKNEPWNTTPREREGEEKAARPSPLLSFDSFISHVIHIRRRPTDRASDGHTCSCSSCARAWTPPLPPPRLIGDKAMERGREVSKGWTNRVVSINKIRIFDQKLQVMYSYTEKEILKGSVQHISIQIKVIRVL